MSDKKLEQIYLGVRDLHLSAASLHGRILTEKIEDPDLKITGGFEVSIDYFGSCGEWFQKEILPRSGEVPIELIDMMGEKLTNAREVMRAVSQFNLDQVTTAVVQVYDVASTLNLMLAEFPKRQPTFPYPPILGVLPGRPSTPDDVPGIDTPPFKKTFV